MSMNEREKPKKPEAEIRQPRSGGFRHMSMDMGDYSLKHSRRELWKFLFHYLKPYRMTFFLFFLLGMLGAGIMAYSPIMTASIIDNGIMAKNYQYLYIMSIIFLSLIFIMAIGSFISSYGMGRISQNVVFEIRNDLFFKLQDMSLKYFEKRPSGDIISILTNDIDQLNQLVGGQFVQIINSILSIALSVLFMYILNPILATISLVIFPIFIVISKYFKKMMIKVFTEARESISIVTSSIQENIQGAKVVQAYGQEDKASSEFNEANEANFAVMLKIRRLMSTFFPFIGFITSILTVIILIAGGLLTINNISIFGISITVGVLTAYISILAQFFRPFMTIAMIQQIIEAAMAASDRIYALLEESVEIPEPENPKEFGDVEGEIEFADISFGYRFKGKTVNAAVSKLMTKPPAGMPPQGMMGQNPMMKRGFEMIKSFPEPYSSFMLKNVMYMPMNIRQKLFMNLMRSKPKDIPKKIDKLLAEFEYAVPKTEMAKKHPEYKTTFKTKGKKGQRPQMGQMMPPETLLMMAKGLERSLSSKGNPQRMGGEGGGMMGGGMRMSPSTMVQMLATMPIPKEIYERFPKIVKNAIEEQKMIIQREKTTGFVLENVNFKISAGTTLAIVGETGAGKTTAIKLLSRFYDINKGSIKIDGIDIREVNKKELRDLIGLVPQDAFIFTGTVRDNLLYAFENPTPEIEQKMIEVSKFLGLHNFIETLHKGYDTKLKENGSNISIGQRQLIAFARALITDPKILVLDEATSSVDPYTELLIQDALNKARKGRTTIIIAHRLSTIKNADHIIVLGKENRSILEQGTHENLIELNGKYKRLIEMQKKDIKI